MKCKICGEDFTDIELLMEHFLDEHLTKLKSIPCLFCEGKEFPNFEDVFHHITLEHKGMASELLEKGTLARETKKRLGDYINPSAKGAAIECPECFEIFGDIDKLNEHRKKIHQMQLDPHFMEEMRKTINESQKVSPPCEKCHKQFLGIVFAKINNKAQHVCLNCYANYYGEEALNKLTIGTPTEMIKKMRTEL